MADYLNIGGARRDGNALEDYFRGVSGDASQLLPNISRLSDGVAEMIRAIDNGEAPAMEGTRYSISRLFTGAAADYANLDENGNVVDGPSLHHVGEGEGAQVYGWGLYATDNREIAEWYANADSAAKSHTSRVRFKDETYESRDLFYWKEEENPKYLALLHVKKNKGDVALSLQELKDRVDYYENKAEPEAKAEMLPLYDGAAMWLEKYKDDVSYEPSGAGAKNIYEQTFFTNREGEGEANLLGWNGAATEYEIELLKNAGISVEDKKAVIDGENVERIQFRYAGELLLQSENVLQINGEDVYSMLSKVLGSPKAASEFLARAGIDGVKYPAGSHGRGDGSKGWNYVSFRDDNIRVDHKWKDGVKQYSISQEFGSAATSLNQVAAGFKTIEKRYGWKEGTTNLDIGGGRYDAATEYLAGRGVENVVFDPFNRTSDANRSAAERARTEKFDTVTCNNVLNVIKEPEVRSNTILQCAKALKPEGTAYFTVYEGSGKGNSRQSQANSWQENRKTASYVDEVKQHFADVERKGQLIVAKNPIVEGKESEWFFDPSFTDGVRYSITVSELKNLGKFQNVIDALSQSDDIEVRQAMPVIDVSKRDAELLSYAHHPITNRERDLKAEINSEQRRKLSSKDALIKTLRNGFTKNDHDTAVANIHALYENAVLLQSRPDAAGDKTLTIHRFAAPFLTEEGIVADALLTLKESNQKENKNKKQRKEKTEDETNTKIYSLELTEIKMPSAQAAANEKSFPYRTDGVNNLIRKREKVKAAIENEAKKLLADNQYSISRVPRNKDLLALHNLSEESLLKAAELGGFPMPSIAVVKDSMGHNAYGDISLLLSSDSIDPKKNKRNRVYSGDAWTPRFPEIRIEASDDVEWRIYDRYKALRDKAGQEIARPLLKYGTDLQDNINRYGEGVKGIVEREMDNLDMMKAFLAESGTAIPEPVMVERTTSMPEGLVRTYDGIVSRMGKEVFDEVPDSLMSPLMQKWLTAHASELEQAYRDATEEYLGRKVDGELDVDVRRLAGRVRRYLRSGATTTVSEEDVAATRKRISDAVDKDAYRKWLSEMFEGAEKSRGIYNGKDRFTSSGKRRPFSALHDPVTLANVVKAMLKTQPEKGGIFGTNPYAAATEEYRNLDAVIADEPRLRELSDDDIKALKDNGAKRLQAVATGIARRIQASKGYESEFGTYTETVDALLDAYMKGMGDTARVKAEMNRDGFYNATDEEIGEFVASMKELRNIPTRYFEAKPARAVDFSEIKAAVVPSGIGREALDVLRKNGIPVYEYEKGDAASRTKAMNDAAKEKGLKFSISRADETFDDDGQFRAGFYTSTEEYSIPKVLMPFLLENPDAETLEVREYLESQGIRVARNEDAERFLAKARRALEEGEAQLASERLEAARTPGAKLTADHRQEIAKLLVPLARRNATAAEAARFLSDRGISATEKAAKDYLDMARTRLPSRSFQRENAVVDWLMQTPMGQIVEGQGAGWKIVPSARFRGQDFSGSFIDPAWIRYSGRKFKSLSAEDVDARLRTAARSNPNMASDVLAKAYVDRFGGDELEVEERIVDFFNGETWDSLYRRMKEQQLDEDRADAAEKQLATITERYARERARRRNRIFCSTVWDSFKFVEKFVAEIVSTNIHKWRRESVKFPSSKRRLT